jgi:hypothetical protein
MEPGQRVRQSLVVSRESAKARRPAKRRKGRKVHHGIALEVVKLPHAKRGFVRLPRRWIVERSFGWAARFRRLARDYERLPDTLAGLHSLPTSSHTRRSRITRDDQVHRAARRPRMERSTFAVRSGATASSAAAQATGDGSLQGWTDAVAGTCSRGDLGWLPGTRGSGTDEGGRGPDGTGRCRASRTVIELSSSGLVSNTLDRMRQILSFNNSQARR